MTTNVYNPAAIQHEFTRKALRYFYEDLPEGEYEGSEDDLREYAATINEGFGYDLDKRIAALEAALRQAQDESGRLREQADGLKQHAAQSLVKFADASAALERQELANERLREALKPFAEAATLVFIEPKIRTLPVEAEYIVAARRALGEE